MRTGGDYRLGSIWLVKFDPSTGTQIRKTRPAVIISGTAFNVRSKVTVLPVSTSKPRNQQLLSIVLPITPYDANGLDEESFLICVEPMTFDKRRLVKYIGQLEDNFFEQFKFIIKQYLDLD